MARRRYDHITQREARRFRRRVRELESFLNGGGVEIGRANMGDTSLNAKAVKVANQLQHPVLAVVWDAGVIVFKALGQVPTVE